VYKIRWNYYHDRIFISASADWTVKIWDNEVETGPIMSFSMGIAVVDVVWAPYSSTVFAASTLEKQMVYDLSIQKYTKMTERKSTTHAKATNLAFNHIDPILAIGDSKGAVILVKLSPKLTSD
jgi:dynein intermediate chain 1